MQFELKTSVEFHKVIHKLPLQYQYLKGIRKGNNVFITQNDFVSNILQTSQAGRIKFYKRISRLDAI
ncbi:MAG: hypothetical protein BGO70_01175 [Bacteroidetes bacterium 43-93]|nr:MAG: hypothetical protein BGO70_01175 [Bacteroidetes bacterium 43-93]